MKKKEYERPTMQVVQLKQQTHLLQASATIDDYQDGDFTWEDD